MTKKIVALAPVPDGLKVRVRHMHTLECKEAAFNSGIKVKQSKLPRYFSYAEVFDPKTGESLASGDAICSYKDVPSRKLGRAIAHNRAIKAYTKGTDHISGV
jgi:hypothetical protein